MMRKTEAPQVIREPIYPNQMQASKYVTATSQPHIIIKNTSAFEA
jgi:hypothetical protein